MIDKQLVRLYTYLVWKYGRYAAITIDCSDMDQLKVQVNGSTILSMSLTLRKLTQFIDDLVTTKGARYAKPKQRNTAA